MEGLEPLLITPGLQDDMIPPYHTPVPEALVDWVINAIAIMSAQHALNALSVKVHHPSLFLESPKCFQMCV